MSEYAILNDTLISEQFVVFPFAQLHEAFGPSIYIITSLLYSINMYVICDLHVICYQLPTTYSAL